MKNLFSNKNSLSFSLEGLVLAWRVKDTDRGLTTDKTCFRLLSPLLQRRGLGWGLTTGLILLTLCGGLFPFANITHAAAPTLTYDRSQFKCVDDTNDDPSDNATHCAADERMYLNEYQLLNTAITFSEPTANTKVVIKIPRRLLSETPVFSLKSGTSVVDGDVVITNTWSNPDDFNIYTFNIKDGTTGDYNIATKVKFNRYYGYEWQEENISTIIKNGETEISKQDTVLKSYVDTKFSLTNAVPKNTIYANNIDTEYVIAYSVQGKKNQWSQYDSFFDENSPTTSIKNPTITIKLPEKADFFVCRLSGCLEGKDRIFYALVYGYFLFRIIGGCWKVKINGQIVLCPGILLRKLLRQMPMQRM